MSNTFGSTGAAYRLVDSRCVRDHRERFRRPALPELELANSFYLTSGRCPSVGWLLLDRNSYDQIDKYSTNLQLKIADYVNETVTISGLSVVTAQSVTRGLEGDLNAIYLIKVAANEAVLYNQWFQFPINRQYNVIDPAYPAKYFDWSMNSGAPWTWSTMLENIWGQAPSQLGVFPGLPSTPSGVPENWIFVGVPLWTAISRVLDTIGMGVVSKRSGAYGIVVPGAADTTFSNLQSKYSSPSSAFYCQEDDAEYVDGGSARVPGQLVVYFPRRNSVYGTEETVRYGSENWQATPAYAVTVTGPSPHNASAGTAYVWDDFTVRYDMDNAPLSADVSTATTIAGERATQFYNSLYRGTKGFMRQVYSGVLPFDCGSLVDGVRWYNTGIGYGHSEVYGGWRTEIVRGYVWDEVRIPSFTPGVPGL